MARPRKPTILKVLEGNPGKRPLPENEPKPAPIAPKCPAHLDKQARREWKRVIALLEPLGLINKLNMAALAAYCQVYSRWIEAEKLIRKHGMIVESPNGYPQLSPYMTIANKSLNQMKSYMVEFGMTPASMSRIDLKPGEVKDNMESLLSGVK